MTGRQRDDDRTTRRKVQASMTFDLVRVWWCKMPIVSILVRRVRGDAAAKRMLEQQWSLSKQLLQSKLSKPHHLLIRRSDAIKLWSYRHEVWQIRWGLLLKCLRAAAAAVSIKVMLRHCDEGRMTPILLWWQLLTLRPCLALVLFGIGTYISWRFFSSTHHIKKD